MRWVCYYVTPTDANNVTPTAQSDGCSIGSEKECIASCASFRNAKCKTGVTPTTVAVSSTVRIAERYLAWVVQREVRI